MPHKDSPFFSVIIPAYNRGHCISAALASITQQSCSSFEIVVVDDGSTDNTAAIVRSIGDPRVRLHQQPNRGVSAARNAGISLAKGAWITFLDSDDDAKPHWLQTVKDQIDANAHAGLMHCGHEVAYIDESQSRTEVIFPSNRGGKRGVSPSLFAAGTFFIRRNVLDATGGYTEELKFSENTELLLRVSAYCREHSIDIVCIDEALTVYRKVSLGTRAIHWSYFENVLHAAEYILRRHAQLLGRDPKTLQDYHAVAGVNAARLGRLKQARSHFLANVQVRPFSARHWSRYAIAWFPSMAKKIWRVEP